MSRVPWRKAMRIRARWALIRLRRPIQPTAPPPDHALIHALRSELADARAEADAERSARLDADERAATAYATAARYQAALGPDGDEILRLHAELAQTRAASEADVEEITRLRSELDQARLDLLAARRAPWESWDRATVEISRQAPGDATLPLRTVWP